ncbi:hypothetical protein TFKS16_2222 [Tannerella forsythia KS16]|jgi:hypothetical protein|uniref:FeoB-associated Cys-rich membrane protein n=2 Tax=Tannerella forsythia TaxID=28112 RepID=G8UL83_TANFA|nr:hypothetical protein [Tannerella forsythia]AEW21806.1 hypothetical protein BFO_2559 [Tannerella forsythia 92A2]OLQ20920.1 hypothetical protein BGK60_09545 [Tannerella forsythia]SCQ22410.1 hypothetical protein TFUB4_02051 [Tannerella forsythia]SCQ23518.1 hypothetical protein TFUB20_02087 [Tannerella forsythia]BAR49687.1 hypothetical protein TF3313_2231 [Tannerella forsythia 3313]
MWQEIAVILIGIAAFGIAGWKLYKILSGSNVSPCDKCTGCQLKEGIRDKKHTCKDYRKTDSLPNEPEV